MPKPRKPKQEPDTGYVVAAVTEHYTIVSYYQGDGEWGQHDHAKVSRLISEAQRLSAEANGFLPEKASGTAVFQCWVNQ